MKEAYQINKIYSIILILAGLIGITARYFEVGDWQFTALIPAFFGLVLFFCTTGIQNENAVIGHVAALLTSLLIIMSVVMLSKGILGDAGWSRKQWIFLIVIVGGIWSLRSQIVYFKTQRKRKASKNKS
ncbi:hypothetical protein BZG02_11720 [Labilibaculum filiforme]|uniref:Uncharacterized protein n=1 Tax=Labilibaculum filiforme TaxID=1940526 RepID=A0A2N3HXR8_9BACT|nr:hypothetical protein [Labilibaculum filiforme]PKQ62855.1 hypothetical protein BZG02_11720 [Labilibaculum filiforme]